MSELASLTAAPTEVVLGGKNYRLAPPRLRDEAEHELWLQKRYAELAAAACGDDVEKLQRVLDDAAAINFYSTFALNTSRTLNGATRLILMGLRQHHSDVTLETLRDTAITQNEMLDARNAYLRLIFPDAAKGDGKKPGSGKESADPKPAASA